MKSAHSSGFRARGFTLVELMTTVAVLAILIAVVPPSLASFVRTSQVRAAQSELISSLMLARSEAAKRGKTVFVSAAAPVTGSEFSAGWRVWVDEDDSGVFNSADTVIRDFPDLAAGVILGTASNATQVSFASSGFLTSASAVDFKVCGKGDASKGYTVSLQPVGLADVDDRATCP